MSKRTEVAVVMGSDSDWELMKDAVRILDEFGIAYEVRVLSAHRTPELAASYARSAIRRGIKVIIAAAGGAAHLPGVLAAYTTLPVIGVPIQGGALNGLDALLSIVQMPAGIPVATVTLGKAGATNAAVLAVEILATSRVDLARRIARYKTDLQQKVRSGNMSVQQSLRKLQKGGTT